MTRTTIYNEVVSKVEETDLSISETRQLYIRALRGNLEVGMIGIQAGADLYDPLTTLPYIEETTYKGFITRYITAIIHQSLLKAGYKDSSSITNTEDFRRELHEVLLAADFDCGYNFNSSIFYHILPVELNHRSPVSLFYRRDEDRDDFQVDGTSYSVRSDERYYITPGMIGELQAVITVYSALNDLSSAVQPSSITVVLNHWDGVHFLDEVLWDGLFSYNTDMIYRWMLTIPDFIY